MLFQEALQHVPDNAVVVEISPHCLLQAVLRRALAGTCTIVGLVDKRQPNSLVHVLTTLGKYVCAHAHTTNTKQEAQLLLGDRATRKHAKDS